MKTASSLSPLLLWREWEIEIIGNDSILNSVFKLFKNHIQIPVSSTFDVLLNSKWHEMGIKSNNNDQIRLLELQVISH